MFKFYGYKIIEMVKKIEHIGIAVKNLEEANKTYERLLGIAPYKQEGVESEGVKTSFFQTGESKIELLEGTTEESAITKFVAKKGEGIHHIAFDVENIHAEMERLRADGFKVLNAEPKDGADNKLVCFVHPKDSHSVLIELCQEKM
ncbi:methylmalonyl-CoA epimerase [Flavobacteriales bacterium]|nr:methylmalonyl-CoA epimerase [Flavobacteriales bacterium]